MSYRSIYMHILKNTRLRIIFVVFIIIVITKFYSSNDNVEYRDNSKKHKNNSKAHTTSCHQSIIESDQFICETDDKWQIRRKFYSEKHDKNILTMNEYKDYFYKNWFPEFTCASETRIGEGDGGKWACDIEYLKLKSPCLVYSLGSGGDFSFEESVHALLPNCSIHTIDIRYSACPENVCVFHQVNIGDGKNGTKTLDQLMMDLNHTSLEIDILKVDIESSEYTLFHTLFSNNPANRNTTSIYIRQILAEVHLDSSRIYETNALFYLLNSQNYVIYHREINEGFPFYACEYGFLKLNRKFFRGHY